MHKPTLLYIILLLVVTAGYSQTKVGVFGGINLSKLNGDIDPDTQYDSKAGVNIGTFIDFKLPKSMYLSLQPSYSQEGTKVTYIPDGTNEAIDSIKVKLNYFSLPILLKVTSTNERFYAVGGIETSILLNSSQTKTGAEEGPIEATIEPLNFSMHFGAGMRFPLGVTTLFVEARYAQGLNNITEDVVIDDLLPRVKSSSIKFLTGIEKPLGTHKN